MLKVLFNQDGSIGGFQFPNFVTQGSHGTESTKIAVAVDGDFDIYDSNLLIEANFRLPDGSYRPTTFPANPEPETFDLLGKTYNCRSIYLSEMETIFAGVLYISIVIKNIATQETLYTYQCKIMIDPSTYSTDGKFEVVSYDNLAQQVLWLYQNTLNPNNTYSKTQADAKFVIKVTDSNVVYGTNLSGEEYHIAYSFNVTALSLVQRDNNGQVLVPETPTADNHATSKKYVDDAIIEASLGEGPVTYDEDTDTLTIDAKLEQTKANDSVEFTIIDSSSGVLTRFGTPFTALKVINGVMWIIGEVVLENNTENAVNNVQVQFYGTVPQKYRSQIKRLDGTTLETNPTAVTIKNTVICTTVMAIGENTFKRVFLSGGNNGQVNVSVTCDFPANDYRVLSVRIPLILL